MAFQLPLASGAVFHRPSTRLFHPELRFTMKWLNQRGCSARRRSAAKRCRFTSIVCPPCHPELSFTVHDIEFCYPELMFVERSAIPTPCPRGPSTTSKRTHGSRHLAAWSSGGASCAHASWALLIRSRVPRMLLGPYLQSSVLFFRALVGGGEGVGGGYPSCSKGVRGSLNHARP